MEEQLSKWHRNANKIIATFMGYKYYPFKHDANDPDFCPGWKRHPNASNFTKTNREEFNDAEAFLSRSHNGLQYHLDEKQQEKVLVKIEDLGYDSEVHCHHDHNGKRNYFLILTRDLSQSCSHGETKKEAIFKGLYQFSLLYLANNNIEMPVLDPI